MKSIIVNVMPEETRIAVKENNRLTSLELERPRHSHLVGNIYKGIVQNVLPGMQAAFVDIGQSKNAFLYIGDGKAEVDGVGSPRKTIHIGQVLPVQITKDEVGTKGPRATMHLTIPGRNVVLMPRSAYIGTSHRIDSEQERHRLYDIVREACPEDMGVIIRTAAMGQSKECIQRDIRYLIKVWQSVEAKSKLMKGTGLLYRDVDLVIRIVRDLFNEDVEQMVIDDEIVYGRVKDLLQGMAPEWADRLKLYKGSNIFEYYEIEAEAVSAGNRQVPLASGGFLVIDKTEAMTVIDVNTGSFVGNISLGETAFALNKEAAVEIMHQLRLRVSLPRFLRCITFCLSQAASFCLSSDILVFTMRRSVSICSSPGPRMPIPPRWRSRWVHMPVRRGSKYWYCASSTCILALAVWAR